MAWQPAFQEPTEVKYVAEFDKGECQNASRAFSHKHKIRYEECKPFTEEQYAIIRANPVYIAYGPLNPIEGGHFCNKNRKGKLYSCKQLKDVTQ